MDTHGWARRILSLVDRNALVTQAKEPFAEHLPSYSAIDLTKIKETIGTQIIFFTFPTMLNRIEAMLGEDAGAEQMEKSKEKVYGLGYFNLIITDEVHHILFNRYQAIFHHFDALVLGLTATPKGRIYRNAYEQFNCPSGGVVELFEDMGAAGPRLLVNTNTNFTLLDLAPELYILSV